VIAEIPTDEKLRVRAAEIPEGRHDSPHSAVQRFVLLDPEEHRRAFWKGVGHADQDVERIVGRNAHKHCRSLPGARFADASRR
jgi:hypothetical protein